MKNSQEEAKQETLEEAAERYEEDDFNQSPTEESAQMMIQRAFITGAKWQQERMYSEEEVKNVIENLVKDCYFMQEPNRDIAKWFEHFKKKLSNN